jgi:hypothetical protein
MTRRDPEPAVPPRADRGRSAPPCPFCDSRAVELVSPWGGQMITAQWRCVSCASYFEAVRDAFDDAPAAERPLSG